MDKEQIAKRAIGLLDLTSLNDDDTNEKIEQLCDKAVGDYGHTAAVCVWPKFISLCKGKLEGTGVKVATVINFPHGSSDIEKTVEDTKKAVEDGADEIDVVFPYKAFLKGDEQIGFDLVKATKEACGDAKLKVIIESGELKKAIHISKASAISIKAGADFIKTSTGKSPVSATLEAANAMIEAIRDSGRDVGFKASGGIRTTGEARDYMAIADAIMGADWISPETFRFGASSLLTDLLESLGYDVDSSSKGGY